MDDVMDKLLRGLARIIIQRGFATSHVFDKKGGRGHFTWTRRGLELRRHLLRLFDVPDFPVASLDHDYIVAVISLILFTGEEGKPPDAGGVKEAEA